MNKKTIYMLVSAIVLVILVFIYISMDKTESTENTEENTESSIFVTNVKNLKQIEVFNSGGSYTARLNDDKYVLEGYENNSISQTDMKYIFSALSNLKAEKIIDETSDNLSKYGLDEGEANVILKGDNEQVLIIGSLTSDKKYRYAMGEDDKVYIVNSSLCELAMKNVKDLIEKSVTAIQAKNVNYLHIKSADKPEIFIKADENNETLKSYVSTSGLSALIMVSPIKDAIVYPTNMQEFVLSDLSALSIYDVAAFNQNNLSEYGLDNPSMEVTIKDSNNELVIKRGKSCDDNTVYALIDNRPEVYIMTKDCFNSFENADIMDFIQNFVKLYKRSEVDWVDVNTNHIELKSEGENKISTDSEGVKRDNRNAYINGKLVDRDTFGDFYEMLAGISFDFVEYNVKKETGSPLYTINYRLSNGKEDRTDFYDYNENFCFIQKENSILLVNKQQLVSLINRINELAV